LCSGLDDLAGKKSGRKNADEVPSRRGFALGNTGGSDELLK
jgi:hypothetical protein